MPQLGQLERDDRDVAPAMCGSEPYRPSRTVAGDGHRIGWHCVLQHYIPQQWHQDSLPSVMVPTAPPVPQDTWAQGTHKTDGTHWHMPVEVSGCRAAAGAPSYPSGWQGALRDRHGHQPHHVTAQVGTGSVLSMPQNLPAEVR